MTAVTGSAFGYHADEITLFGGSQADVGPTPAVTLAADASNSPQTATASTGVVAYGPARLFTADQIDVGSSGALGGSGSVSSFSELDNVNQAATQPATGSEILTATMIRGECTSSAAGTTGTTTITNGTLRTDNGLDLNGDGDFVDSGEHAPVVVGVPASPAPGVSISGHIHVSTTDKDDFRVVFNEQSTSAGVLTVTAAHEILGTEPPDLLTGHLYLGRAVCGVAATQLNDPPVAANDTYATNAGQALVVPAPGVLANDSDPDGDPLVVGMWSNPSSGTLAINANGSFTYTPNSGFSGSDSFTYMAHDPSDAMSDPATVAITVNPPANQAPVAQNDAYSTQEDTPLTVASPGVLANDTDADGDPLSAGGASNPPNGSVALGANGSFTYTPDANFNGTDSFTYAASDGRGGTSTATVTITVTAVNDQPVANNDAYSTNEGTQLVVAAPGVLANDSDADGDTLTAAMPTNPANGNLTLEGSGGFTYTPNAGFSGSDSFTYMAHDPNGGMTTATVNITVNDVAAADVAVSVGAPATATVRSAYSYTVTVTNSGPDAASGVSLLTNATGARMVSASASNGASCAVLKGKTKGASCALGNLAVGETVTVTVNVTAPTKPGTVAYSAEVSSTSSDPNAGNDSDNDDSTSVVR